MAVLTDEQKIEIVLAHARFRSGTQIREMLRDEHGLDVPLTQIVKFNPARASYEGAEQYRAAYEAARKAYLEEVSSVPIANQGFRLNGLQHAYDRAVKRGNDILAASLMEQASKEVGGAYTNERNLTVRKGVDDMSAEERRMAFVEVMRKALGEDDPVGMIAGPGVVQ